MAEGLLVYDLPAVADQKDRAGDGLVVNFLLDQFVHGGKVHRRYGLYRRIRRGLAERRSYDKGKKADAEKCGQPRFRAQEFHLWIQCVINRKQKQPGDSLKQTAPHLLSDDFADQDKVFGEAFAVLREGIEKKAFPGASLAVAHRGKLVALRGLGRFTYDSTSREVNAATVYDLASLTKVVATTAMCMRLYDRGLFHLEQKVAEVLPDFASRDARRKEITFRMLLAHSSGLPAYAKFFETAKNREELLDRALKVPLVDDPGARAEYSDIGFIILGEALERIAGESLDAFSKRETFEPLGLSIAFASLTHSSAELIPPTEDDVNFRHRVIQGQVHDENACVMGGVAGHAGCFATALDLATFGQCMLNGGAPLLKTHTVEIFTRREVFPEGTSRALGWDTPSHPSQSGKYLSPRAYGHLGYTGTSLWNDPERQLSVTLLTNRTWPDRSSQAIKKIRPAFHDAVIEALS